MPGSFNHQEIMELARKADMSPKAAKRLCGALRVQHAESSWQIGLNLFDSDFFAGRTRSELIQEACELISRLKGRCPRVFSWVCRGDFNPQKLPESIGRGELLHCARTAASLRAQALRARQETLF